MRVLFAALHPPGGRLPFGGVQSWIDTVARRLSTAGLDVSVWGPEFPLPRQRFQLGVIAHRQVTKFAMPLCEANAFVSHGVVDEEQSGDGLTFFTSEDVRAHWKASGPILRQPIDLELWRPDLTERRKTLVFYSYRASEVFGLNALAQSLGLEFVWLRDVAANEALPVLQQATLVCASGRAALEAMACDTPTMICDWRDYNGRPLVCANIEKAMAYNYSGRGGVPPADIDMRMLAKETIAFQRPREHVERHHDADRIVGELLKHADDYHANRGAA